MASVIPRSKNTTLPASFAASIVLAMLPKASRPSVVLQVYVSASSDRLIIGVPGILASSDIRLLRRLQLPSLPSLNESATGIYASFVIVAHPEKMNVDARIEKYFKQILGLSILDLPFYCIV
tara:strand:+ start:277 stop:642 length:366 start_codon:yes stop_codon:yes gene_type:complete